MIPNLKDEVTHQSNQLESIQYQEERSYTTNQA